MLLYLRRKATFKNTNKLTEMWKFVSIMHRQATYGALELISHPFMSPAAHQEFLPWLTRSSERSRTRQIGF